MREAGIPADKVMVGTGCCSVADTLALTKHSLELGYSNVLVLPPFYYKVRLFWLGGSCVLDAAYRAECRPRSLSCSNFVCVRWWAGQNVGDDGLFASYARLLDSIGASNLGEHCWPCVSDRLLTSVVV